MTISTRDRRAMILLGVCLLLLLVLRFRRVRRQGNERSRRDPTQFPWRRRGWPGCVRTVATLAGKAVGVETGER